MSRKVIPLAGKSRQELFNKVAQISSQEPVQIITSAKDNPADMLDAAASVTRFLAEISPWLNYNNSDMGISTKGAYGLNLILQTLENTIEAAAEKL